MAYTPVYGSAKGSQYNVGGGFTGAGGLVYSKNTAEGNLLERRANAFLADPFRFKKADGNPYKSLDEYLGGIDPVALLTAADKFKAQQPAPVVVSPEQAVAQGVSASQSGVDLSKTNLGRIDKSGLFSAKVNSVLAQEKSKNDAVNNANQSQSLFRRQSLISQIVKRKNNSLLGSTDLIGSSSPELSSGRKTLLGL